MKITFIFAIIITFFLLSLCLYSNDYNNHNNPDVFDLSISFNNASTSQEMLELIEIARKMPDTAHGNLIFYMTESFNVNIPGNCLWETPANDTVFDMTKRSARILYILREVFYINVLPITINTSKNDEVKILSFAYNSYFKTNNIMHQIRKKKEADIIIKKIEPYSLDNLTNYLSRTKIQEVLAYFATNNNRNIRLTVVNNYWTDNATVEKMINDEDNEISLIAKSARFRAHTLNLENVEKFDWLGFTKYKILFSSSQEELNMCAKKIISSTTVFQNEILIWLINKLPDLRYSPSLGGDVPDDCHDISLVGGKAAYLLEHILDDNIIPINKTTSQEQIIQEQQRLLHKLKNKL